MCVSLSSVQWMSNTRLAYHVRDTNADPELAAGSHGPVADLPFQPGIPNEGGAESGTGVEAGERDEQAAEIVHESGRTWITRLVLAGRTVIRKEPLGPDAEHRLRHEAAMLKRLCDVAGVAQLVEASRYPGAIMLDDAGEGIWPPSRSRWRSMT